MRTGWPVERAPSVGVPEMWVSGMLWDWGGRTTGDEAGAGAARGATARLRAALGRLVEAPEPAGLILGALAFFAALVPSLIPRGELVQGATAGLAFAIGYAAGAGLRRLAELLQIVAIRPVGERRIWPAAILAGLVVAAGLVLAPGWQNGVRAVMAMPPLDGLRGGITALVALGVGLVLMLIGRLFRLLWVAVAAILRPVLPPRVAGLVGLALAIAATWGLASGVIARAAVDGLDKAYARLDALIPPDRAAPADPLKSGSPASLVAWETLGAAGRDHMLAEPDRAGIEALAGGPARQPIRVYVGLNAADTPEARADLALAELRRTGAFERKVLVIATPTGTGWIDPAASAPLEYLLRGDVATVSVQYSYLPSWLSLLVEPENGVETARAVFRRVHAAWAEMPPERRPRLYLFGLSLGALNSDLSVDLYDILGAPHHGALWVGPPFRSRTWRGIVAARNPGTPVWLPRYSDGRMFRFTTQQGALDEGFGAWGPLRVIYLQYGSDPIVFFETGSLWRRPRIAQAPRPPDIAPGFTWVPVISFVQMVVDMMTATLTPPGRGHVYAAEDYLRGWVALLEPEDWPPERLEALRRHLAARGL